MKHLLMSLLVGTLVGAGCGTPPGPALRQEQAAATSVAMPSDLCTEQPEENDMGRLVYPIDPAYWNMPHLGQIFTALDCGDKERTLKVRGFEGENYTAGINITWEEGAPTATVQSALQKMGFVETKRRTWILETPLTLPDLETLQTLLTDPENAKRLEYEDCLKCG